MTLKPFPAAVVVTIVAIFAIPPVRAATARDQVQADLGNPALVIRLNADGSLVVSQGEKAAGTPITLPSLQGLPAEIDALVPPPRQKKMLAVKAESTTSYKNFMILMNQARKAGFADIGVLDVGKSPCDGSSDLTIHIQNNALILNGKPFFVSLGDDGNVTLSLGIGAEARGMTVKLDGALDAATGLVPEGRRKKQAYFRADFGVSVGSVFDLMHKLGAIGFCKLGLVGEETE